VSHNRGSVGETTADLNLPVEEPDALAHEAVAHNGCPMDAVLRTLMGTWTTYILWLLRSSERLRFGEIKTLMPGISSKVLTERLRHLEAAGLIDRDYRPTIPPTVSYALTQRGRELKDVLDSLDGIAKRWRSEDVATRADGDGNGNGNGGIDPVSTPNV
jgi:DNA-binding HxlR family transcriptional regulator